MRKKILLFSFMLAFAVTFLTINAFAEVLVDSSDSSAIRITVTNDTLMKWENVSVTLSAAHKRVVFEQITPFDSGLILPGESQTAVFSMSVKPDYILIFSAGGAAVLTAAAVVYILVKKKKRAPAALILLALMLTALPISASASDSTRTVTEDFTVIFEEKEYACMATFDYTPPEGTEILDFTNGGWDASEGLISSAICTPSALIRNIGQYNGETGENYAFQADVEITQTRTKAGIFFCMSKSGFYEGIEGYFVAVTRRGMYLYKYTGSPETGEDEIELGKHMFEEFELGMTCTLRVEIYGSLCRVYLLDDAEGVEPWPEFEFTLDDFETGSIGIMDSGFGACYSNVKFETLEPLPADTAAKYYQNHVLDGYADPDVLYYDGKYYMYATSYYVEKGYEVYTSTDLVNWTNEGMTLTEAWGIDHWYWAPDVEEIDGKFYMIATVAEHVGIAVADSPLGPFIPEGNWLFESTIDGHIFVDDDGTMYIYYVSWREGYAYGIYGVKMMDDYVTPDMSTET